MMGNWGNNNQLGMMGHYSDISYVGHLVNGSTAPFVIESRETSVKLRIINAYVDGFINLVYAGGNFTVLASDGLPIKPFETDHLPMGMGETYDISLPVINGKQAELVSFFLGGNTSDISRVLIGSGQALKLKSYNFNRYATQFIYNKIETEVPNFVNLAQGKTATKTFDFGLIGGHMDYSWAIADRTGRAVEALDLKVGDKVAISFTNATMMPHPMHLHGHFFKVIGQNNNTLVKHTYTVMPNEQVTFEFEVDAEGNWLLHCHNLFHMASGMMITLSVTK
jgi:FtsP/CotA-like multicopper oxidase with cupredoxin domain